MVQLLAGQSSVASVMITGLACRDGTVKLKLNQNGTVGYSDPNSFNQEQNKNIWFNR
jgi:hypothetical protein